MPKRTVLILTQPFDFPVDDVILKLHNRGVDIVRFDTGWFPGQSSLVAQIANVSPEDAPLRITSEIGKPIDLSEVASIWLRRPRDFSFDERLDPDAREFARNESRTGLGGLLRSLDCMWINHPEKDTSASFKPFQLTSAVKVGLSVPRTLITNDPQAAREFIGNGERAVIYKTMSSPRIPSGKYQSPSLFTSRISAADMEAIDTVKYTPCLLQEFVPKDFEVRVTIIGPKVFSVAIHAPEGTTDWRQVADTDLRYSVYDLPQDIEDRLLRLVRGMDLTYAAIDLVVTPEHEHVFLELNPSGQWAWLEDATGLPMADALADCLAPFSAPLVGAAET